LKLRALLTAVLSMALVVMASGIAEAGIRVRPIWWCATRKRA